MEIVQVASEFSPLASVGDLGPAVRALTHALLEQGHRLTVFLPGYRSVFDHPKARAATKCLELSIALGDHTATAELWLLPLGERLTLALLARDEFYDRRGVYGTVERAYDDNDSRFVFFAKAVVEAMARLDLRPAAVHCHDWPAALVPLYLRLAVAQGRMTAPARTVLTIHDIAYAGLFPRRSFALCNLPESYFRSDSLEYHGQLSVLKAGLLFADALTVWAPGYRAQLLQASGGRGLHGVLSARANDLLAVLPGPGHAGEEPIAPGTATEARPRAERRAALLEAWRLPRDFAGPLFVLEEWPSAPLLPELAPTLREVLGGGRAALLLAPRGTTYPRAGFQALAAEPNAHFRLQENLEAWPRRQLLEAADFYLLVAEAEPVGLAQLHARAHGCIPLLSATGGLPDTTVDLRSDAEAGHGWLFANTPESLAQALRAALALAASPTELDAVRRRVLPGQLSWAKTATDYARLYRGEDLAPAPVA